MQNTVFTREFVLKVTGEGEAAGPSCEQRCLVVEVYLRIPSHPSPSHSSTCSSALIVGHCALIFVLR